jgi:hypothetical protein
MSIKINFDVSNNPETPTLILAYRDGRKIDEIVADSIVVKDSMNNSSEMSFKVRKFINGKKNHLWDKIVDFKLLWYKEADIWYEIYVEIDESNETIKSVSCVQLGRAELSQIKLYNIEINTENDIARDDYLIPTILYNEDHSEASLLHRIMDKAEHYSVIHVDNTIANIQRTFTFDNTSIYDACQEIAEEIGCLFVFHSNSDGNGKIQRTISVYDLESNCNICGHRGEFTAICPECGSSDINEGYGEDTTIFITSDELADNIQFSSDTGSIKNCFKLEAGDDLMTATIRNCNPNGTDYIWYISDDVKVDMSQELVKKLDSYDIEYKKYQNDYVADIDESTLIEYNNLIKKYQLYNTDLQEIPSTIKGYPALMTAIYNTIDLSLYLESALMPDATMQNTNAIEQAALLTSDNLSPVSVTDVSKISLATANSVVLSVAKIIVDSRYRVKINDSSLIGQTWTGNFIVTNYSDNEDIATSSTISIIINDDYEYFVQQKLDKAIKENDTDELSVTGLFKLDYNSFCEELKKYSLNCLTSFHDACQVCIDILIEQGIGNAETWSGSDPNLYNDLYTPYYQKLIAIEIELKLRQNEIDLIEGVYDSDGVLIQAGLQTLLNDIRNKIQEQLDFQNYIGNELWLEFCAYRREDKYSNDNYISDGLSNSELFEKALEFHKVAKNEIYKSAELQHSISSSLKNLLVIEKFKPLVKHFKTGNWLRTMVDDKVYKLRLLDYEIDFDNIDSLSVDFSDVLNTANGEADQKSIMSKLTSMASSYSSIKRQASQGGQSNVVLNNWFENGLNLTKTKIINSYDEGLLFDKNGFWCRQYDPITGTYSDEQIKIINSTIAITDDNWNTTKTAIGKFYYTDAKGEEKVAYGVNGETIVGKFILGENLSIRSSSGNLIFDGNGLTITSESEDGIGTMTFNEDGLIVRHGNNTVTISPKSKEVMNITNGTINVFEVNEDGELSINGNIMARSLRLESGVTIDSGVITNLATVATSGSYNDLIDTPNIPDVSDLANVAFSGDYKDLINIPTFATVATSGKYSDLIDVPEIPEAVDISGKFDNPINNQESVVGQYLSKDTEGSTWKAAETQIEPDGILPVSGKAVYDFALSKKQDTENAGKLLYVDADGNITPISIDDLKALLNTQNGEV